MARLRNVFGFAIEIPVRRGALANHSNPSSPGGEPVSQLVATRPGSGRHAEHDILIVAVDGGGTGLPEIVWAVTRSEGEQAIAGRVGQWLRRCGERAGG